MPLYACFVVEADRFDARTNWIAQQSANATIAPVIHLINTNARPDIDELEVDLTLKLYSDIKDALIKYCNERTIFTQILVPAALRKEVFRALD